LYLDSFSQVKPLVAITGPTGSGKSSLAVFLAQCFNGEIVNADSRQVYRHMDIGTAKPSPEDMSSVPHHLFNLIDPDEDFSLAEYLAHAASAIEAILERGKLPFLVGGSGQYLWALLEGWQIPHAAPDAGFRRQLEKIAAEKGAGALYNRLIEMNPEAASKIDERNIRRVIRALEISQHPDGFSSGVSRKKKPGYNTAIIGLTSDRGELYSRVDHRVDSMIQEGLVDEVKQLVKLGFNSNLASMNSIGYRQIDLLLRDEIDLAEAARQIKVDTHRFIRHQYAWFKLGDRRIHWFDIRGEIRFEIMMLLSDFLNLLW
jgi:tRNA dimethylallyltransferase